MSTLDEEKKVFQFMPFKSFVSPTFWHKLFETKIDIDRLSDAAKPIYGYYTNFNSKSCLLEIDYSSFNTSFVPPKNCYTSVGTLYNKNTIEDFKTCDKNALLQEEGRLLLEDLKSGRILDDLTLLCRFIVLSFADLKTHTFYYWFAFPCPLEPVFLVNPNDSPKQMSDVPELANLTNTLESLPHRDQNYFIVHKGDCSIRKLKDAIDINNLNENFRNENLENLYFCFADPSEYESPSWIMRIYAAFLCSTCPLLTGNTINFLSLRYRSEGKYNSSLIWRVFLPPRNESTNAVQFVGWEPNKNNKMGPRMTCMRDSMDPVKLAENSINMNLKLMKWRLVPDLNLERLYETKCLLFGAGSLGCAVARNLLGWGFKHITFIDSGKVSFSNPVRQYLFKHIDAVDGNKLKAPTAAERLLEINPSTITKGHVVHIPMPGHPFSESENKTSGDVEKIIELVNAHDVLFLLTDSRESRWLPTMLGAAYNKIVINAALGFDSYLVMRHGLSIEDSEEMDSKCFWGMKCIPGSQIGCYFCNDVTAPGNSQKDRTLDQQCTVTRPGVSNVAASYAVELLVSILQHPEGGNAPAYLSVKDKDTDDKESNEGAESLLGIIPHSIRGMLYNYENILPTTLRFSQCIACSKNVIREFKTRRLEFLSEVFQSAEVLQDLTGISEMLKLDTGDILGDDLNFDSSED